MLDEIKIQNTVNEQLELTRRYFEQAQSHAFGGENTAMASAYGAAQACFEALDRWIKRYKTLPDDWKTS